MPTPTTRRGYPSVYPASPHDLVDSERPFGSVRVSYVGDHTPDIRRAERAAISHLEATLEKEHTTYQGTVQQEHPFATGKLPLGKVGPSSPLRTFVSQSLHPTKSPIVAQESEALWELAQLQVAAIHKASPMPWLLPAREPTGHILLTGFMPFGKHKVNASWEAVKTFDGASFGGWKVHAQEIPVLYKDQILRVGALWDKVKPDLCVHVGVVHPGPLHLEKLARNREYCYPDTDGAYPPEGCVVDLPDAPPRLSSTVDVDAVLARLKRTGHSGVPITGSVDAGLYLCEFTYYCSLLRGGQETPALFVHVPPAGEPYSQDDINLMLGLVLDAVVAEVKAGREQTADTHVDHTHAVHRTLSAAQREQVAAQALQELIAQGATHLG